MTENNILLRIEGSDLDETRLQALSNDLARAIREEGLGHARYPTEAAPSGSKGDPVTIGALVLTLIGSGGVAGKLVDVLKAILERKPTLTFNLTRANGEKVSIGAINLSKPQLETTQKLIADFLRD